MFSNKVTDRNVTTGTIGWLEPQDVNRSNWYFIYIYAAFKNDLY